MSEWFFRQQFKKDTENFGIVGNRVNQLILWTKQGTNKLNTDDEKLSSILSKSDKNRKNEVYSRLTQYVTQIKTEKMKSIAEGTNSYLSSKNETRI